MNEKELEEIVQESMKGIERPGDPAVVPGSRADIEAILREAGISEREIESLLEGLDLPS